MLSFVTPSVINSSPHYTSHADGPRAGVGPQDCPDLADEDAIKGMNRRQHLGQLMGEGRGVSVHHGRFLQGSHLSDDLRQSLEGPPPSPHVLYRQKLAA